MNVPFDHSPIFYTVMPPLTRKKWQMPCYVSSGQIAGVIRNQGDSMAAAFPRSLSCLAAYRAALIFAAVLTVSVIFPAFIGDDKTGCLGNIQENMKSSVKLILDWVFIRKSFASLFSIACRLHWRSEVAPSGFVFAVKLY
jgi:hypothetical protein